MRIGSKAKRLLHIFLLSRQRPNCLRHGLYCTCLVYMIFGGSCGLSFSCCKYWLRIADGGSALNRCSMARAPRGFRNTMSQLDRFSKTLFMLRNQFRVWTISVNTVALHVTKAPSSDPKESVSKKHVRDQHLRSFQDTERNLDM